MPDHTCQNRACGMTFTGRRRRFCYECLPRHAVVGNKAYMERYNQLELVRRGSAPRSCTVCGDEYRVQSSGTRCRTCVKLGKKRCSRCSQVFSGDKGRLTCSACRTATCIVCQLPFVSDGARQRICSPQCKESRRLWLKRTQSRRRRVRRGGVLKGPYHDLEVFDRDGWRCQICGRLTKPWLRVPHPLAPTVDHIVPLSKGGADAAHNVQCAHFKCNTAKRDGAANDQLRIVG